MLHSRVRCPLLVSAIGHTLLFCLPIYASDERLTEAQALITRADQLSVLSLPGSPPFLAQGTVQRSASAKSTPYSVKYSLFWERKDKWVEVVETAGLSESQLRNEEGLWLPKDPVNTLDSTFAFSQGFPFMANAVRWDEKIKGLSQRRIGGKKLTCATVERPRVLRELCFAPDSGLLTQVVSNVTVMSTGQLSRRRSEEIITEYLDYTKIGGRTLPSNIREYLNGQLRAEIRVLKVGIDVRVPARMFSVPAGYEVWPACEHYEPAAMPPSFWRYSMRDVRHDWFDSYEHVADGIRVSVGPDGKAEQVTLINPTGRNSKELVSIFKNGAYTPASCDGHPVRGVTKMTFSVP